MKIMEVDREAGENQIFIVAVRICARVKIIQ